MRHKKAIMVQSKTELFEQELIEKAALFKALAHPARLQILQFLAATQSCITGDISDELPLGRTTVNQHLKELKAAGLVTGHIEGVKTKYCLDMDNVKRLREELGGFIDDLHIDNYCCE
ncbi:transcriptional regulator [Prolixibacter bellariivorans]|uniref:Transcriptional regulator n=2 Tax=Prolixibacter bellariivorans TaxID=314319 RepID=A0A5M4B432_9BACT|nr:transcriptional regulator [Prolixibacter bellariivorans]